MFVWPQPDAEALASNYGPGYYVFHEPPARRWARAVQVYLNHLLPLEGRTGRRLLEVGCAGGHLLALARARGWEVQGVELSAEAAAAAHQEFGLEVFAGTIDSFVTGMAAEPFDMAVAVDVLEHVPSPLTFLRCLRRQVRPGGWLAVETPNWGGRWRRL
ncbi:MAG: class I SAM-dependent methyltransferase, partial [Rhodocyclaceae bacterium]|nr:class I SAM-dependent methyltransferase [Rhodocyclaceae bacterium]